MTREIPVSINQRSAIINEFDIDVLSFVESYVSLDKNVHILFLDSSSYKIFESLYDFHCSHERAIKCVINVNRLNDVRFVNKLLEASNDVLPDGGLFFGHVETAFIRKSRIFQNYPKPISKVIYLFHFIFKRVFPKLPLIKKVYYFLTQGKNRVISEMEVYGRLYSCGFELLDSKLINGETWVVAKKLTAPVFNIEATYGPLIKLRRYGMNNEMFKVYKLRTMYPFSEYLQDYVSSKQGLQKGGKFKNDPRVTTLGRFFRKYWLDELPMFINVLKGEMKLFGVRPLSGHYFGLYPEYLKELRAKVKPGLIPPFYADLPETLDEIIDSEEKYILSYLSSPLLTDLRYFSKAIYNIIFKRVRSN